MTWTHPEIPWRFRHVHPLWKVMSGTERRAFGNRLAEREDWATLYLFEAWIDWYASETSPLRWRVEVAR